MTNNVVRNLFTIDYMKEHPGTTVADFKKVFNSIDKDTKKVFDVISLPWQRIDTFAP
jgi:hypothetical protein